MRDYINRFKPKNNRRAWTTDDEKNMIVLLNRGFSYAKVARILGRTYCGVRNRIYRIRSQNA